MLPAMASHGVTNPSFLYIGAEKAGSSWIYQILREHPDVFVPEAKDIYFFDRFYDKGVDWYLSHFRGASDKTAVGEICHDYFLSVQTAERIHQHLPDARLICCLREPVERTISAYVYYQTIRVNDGTSFEQFAFRPAILKHSDYYNNLVPFYRLFPSERILVLFYDDLKADAAGFAKAIYSFLGVDPAFSPPSLHRVVLPARQARSVLLSHVAYSVARVMRKLGLANLLGTLKRKVESSSLMYREMPQKPEIPESVKQRLRAHFMPDYEKLSSLIGRELPAKWTKGWE